MARAETPVEETTRWLVQEGTVATALMFDNITPLGARRGTIVASPSRSKPNYYYYWIRDGALVMNSVRTLYRNAVNRRDRDMLRQKMFDYADLSDENQQSNALTGLGEPRFNMDGSPNTEDWGRPQNDGPALRAITLLGFAADLEAEGHGSYIPQRLYRAELPAQSIIKRDLEYTAHHWRDSSVDLWEEVRGAHFYTRMAQRKALLFGSKLARRQGDVGAADFYLQGGLALQGELERHWDAHRGIIIATLDYVGGDRGKTSQLDSAVILAANHGDLNDPTDVWAPANERVLSALYNLRERFRHDYIINHRTDLAGIAVGRYPEDVYGGEQTPYGNPWVLINMGYSEVLYKAIAQIQTSGSITVTRYNAPLFNAALVGAHSTMQVTSGRRLSQGQPAFADLLRALTLEADFYVLRVKAHANPDGSLAEQMDRNNGFMVSARNLTWNYASVISAVEARSKIYTGAAPASVGSNACQETMVGRVAPAISRWGNFLPPDVI